MTDPNCFKQLIILSVLTGIKYQWNILNFFKRVFLKKFIIVLLISRERNLLFLFLSLFHFKSFFFLSFPSLSFPSFSFYHNLFLSSSFFRLFSLNILIFFIFFIFLIFLIFILFVFFLVFLQTTIILFM